MELKNKLSKAGEVSFAVVAISALILAGCGGSKSSATSTGAVAKAESAFILDAKLGNIWYWNASQSMNASGVPVIVAAGAGAMTLTSTATANNYTVSNIRRSITLPSPGTWSVVPNAVQLGVTNTSYNLTSAGWVLNPSVTTLVNDGTSLSIAGTTAKVTPAKVDLSGQAVVCTSSMSSNPVHPATANRPAVTSAPCAVATTYPVGAALYTEVEVRPADQYSLWDQTGAKASTMTLTDSSGVVLTALPAVGATFCLGWTGFDAAGNAVKGGEVFVPIAGADNYGVRSAASCAAADITAAVNAGAAGQQTVLLASKATGLSGVTVLTRTWTGNSSSWAQIFAFNAGKLMTGSMQAAGTDTWYYVNKLTANAQLTAHGIPALP